MFKFLLKLLKFRFILFIFLLKLFKFLLKLFMFLLKLFMLFQLLLLLLFQLLFPLKLGPLKPILPSSPVMKPFILPLKPFILKPLPLFKAKAVDASKTQATVMVREFILGNWWAETLKRLNQ